MLENNKKRCTGCGACVWKCPKQCITWNIEELGFRYPVIDMSECVNCGVCENVCPIDKPVVKQTGQRVYAAIHKDKEILTRSTSGGAFSAIASYFLKNNGIVYGAAMQEEMQVRHIRVVKEEELVELRGSKYVQSDTGITYQQAEDDLKSGKKVFYSGTPCQIDGLKKFLGKEYENLFTADLICHGVGSQKYFDKYMEFARERYGEIKELHFRSKKTSGWRYDGKIIYLNSFGKKVEKSYRDYNNYYYSYFLLGDIFRSSCYTCKYANTDRPGDFTLGDYWGVEALKLPLDTENGCSLLIINNSHAMELLNGIKDLELINTTVEQAVRCNRQLSATSILTLDREKRIDEYENLTGIQIQRNYLRSHRKMILYGIIKLIIPYKVKLIIRSMRT